jgi:hypothetical protein
LAPEETGVHAAHTVIAGREEDVAAEVGVAEAGADAGVEAVDVGVGGDDGGEAVVVAVVENLVELFDGPGGRLLGSEVVNDEEVGGAYLLEALVIGDVGSGGVGSAELVEEVGGNGEVDLHAVVLDDVVGDGGGEVGLAATVAAEEEEPAFGVGGEFDSSGVGFARAIYFGVEVGEYLVLEGVEVAKAVEVFKVALFGSGGTADARVELAEAKIADRDVHTQPAGTAAVGANVSVGVGCRVSGVGS